MLSRQEEKIVGVTHGDDFVASSGGFERFDRDRLPRYEATIESVVHAFVVELMCFAFFLH